MESPPPRGKHCAQSGHNATLIAEGNETSAGKELWSTRNKIDKKERQTIVIEVLT